MASAVGAGLAHAPLMMACLALADALALVYPVVEDHALLGRIFGFFHSHNTGSEEYYW
jgi:hypothetical protein